MKTPFNNSEYKVIMYASLASNEMKDCFMEAVP